VKAKAPGDTTTFTYEMSCGDTSTALRVTLRLREGVESSFPEGDTLIAVPEGAFRRSITIALFPTGERREERYTLVLERRFEFDDIVHAQLGGRLLMVINNPAHNGGHTFREARWWVTKGGEAQELSGSSNRFYYVPSTPITDSIFVWLEEEETGTVLKSCADVPSGSSGAPTGARASVYPNPVAAGGVVHLRAAAGHTATLPDEHPAARYATYRLLDVQGALQRSGSAAELQNGLRMPSIPGSYFLVLEGKNGKITILVISY
jgi:hypothetical protein